MSKNPRSLKLHEWQNSRSSGSTTTAKGVTDDRLQLHCMVCSKSIEGFYARFGEEGTCAKSCMEVQDKKPRYPGHSEEEFCQRFNL